jgi:hypothetical protein
MGVTSGNTVYAIRKQDFSAPVEKDSSTPVEKDSSTPRHFGTIEKKPKLKFLKILLLALYFCFSQYLGLCFFYFITSN